MLFRSYTLSTTAASNVIEPDGQVHPGVSLGALVQAGPFLKEHLSGRDFCSFFIVLEKIRDTRTHLPFLWNVIDLIFSSEGILF